MHLSDLQKFMSERGVDAWLVWDFRNSNPNLARLVPVKVAGGKRFLTRRCALWIPARGEPELLAHAIDRSAFEGAVLAGGATIKMGTYLSWQDLHKWMRERIAACGGKVAMEYAAENALPVVSIVDAGTVELVRSMGAEVKSSADLIQFAVARWDEVARTSHERASVKVAAIKDGVFALMRERLCGGGRVTEWEAHQYIHERFQKEGLETPDGPIVAVNAHGADPHFENTRENSKEIRRGHWVLLDLWAREPGDEHVFSDITWVAFAGERPTERHARVFGAVKGGRDAAVALAKQRMCRGWELDEVCRKVIVDAGYGAFIKHRTGHSLSPGPLVHGYGVNIDNLETHDTRELLPGVGFTVEPGVYIPDGPEGPGFGVRLEINVWMDPSAGARITSCVQDEVVRLV